MLQMARTPAREAPKAVSRATFSFTEYSKWMPRRGASRARVTQVMRLLDLAPAIQDHIERDRSSGRGLAQTALRKIAMLDEHQDQVEAFEQALGEQPSASDRSQHRKAPRPRGFQHLFDRARRYRTMLDADPQLTLVALGKLEGITGTRVGQVLALLHLAPEIVAVLDVPVGEVPAGIRYAEVRKLARMRDRGEQVRRFEAFLGQAGQP